ncbi:xanthine dehydrogenase family protein molybdopterin-binding subunit [Bradyrhizobium sp. WSM 1738]|uniref:xanthine dehydrogenase family protein molybdopterin-binding subunit n=1 Tax=Bradyrhizobium hereditatis TaxID=2821405 RepID=UPI001CE27EDC|nr:xanthine dehydrogenase family protein molybdopterin-binding subunit [Bradyrhizobium hereditatis]MCA6113461.1 xanthine dehydrogenase family protein molybdopterin-binding subunit [Bradyrhizobium hereditatis]
MTEPLLGRSINRNEDERFVRGRGRYIADLTAPKALHGVVVRSPHAHARITAINADAARQMPGVSAVLTGADLAADHIGPLPCAVTQIPMTTPLVVPPYHALARDVVRYVGEPIAFVVAESPEAARDAAEAVAVDYEPLPPVVAILDAIQPDAPSIWPEARGNIAFQFNRGELDPVEASIRDAAHVVECELVNNRVVAAPLETRGALGEFDAASGRLHLTASAAGAHGIRNPLADDVFRIGRDKLRVSIPDVGGGFGMKNVLYPEWVLVLWAARRLGRPVKWIGDRNEDFTGSAHGRDSFVRARLALDRDGRFLALDTKVFANLGAYVSTVAPAVPTMAMGSAMGGVYDIPLIAFETKGVFTNTTPVDAYRGAGKPEANYLIERCIDIAAHQLGMDALKLRRKNIFRRFPHASAMGLSVEQGSFGLAIDHAVAAANGFKTRQKSSRARGRLRGLGYACFLETARGQPNEVAEVRVGEDGQIDLMVGTHSNGQGHETTFAQIAADALGLPLTRFRFRQGDTDDLDSGGGHGGARSMHQGGTALLMAAEGVIENARRLAARLLQASVDAVQYEAGMLRVAATGQEISLDEVARASYQAHGDDVAPGLAHQATHLCNRYTFPNGCHLAEVEIDPETGAVKLDRYVIFDDYGRLLDPRLTLGQVHGGVAQGIGQALFEQALFDAETGQFLSGSLMDYALPRADDLPAFEGNLTSDFPSRANRLGVKGSGQAGAIAAPATIMNAVMNALAPLGVRHLDMPATPERIWHAIQAAEAQSRTGTTSAEQ